MAKVLGLPVRGRLRVDAAAYSEAYADQAWAAYVEFWQKAMGDYSKEYLLIGSLAAGVTTKSLAAAQSATQEVSMEMLPLLKAA